MFQLLLKSFLLPIYHWKSDWPVAVSFSLHRDAKEYPNRSLPVPTEQERYMDFFLFILKSAPGEREREREKDLFHFP